MWRYAFSLSGSRQAADDLTQAAVLRALEHSQQFDPDTHLARWMFRILQNLWLNDRRAIKVRLGQGQVPAEDAQLPDPGADTEMNILVREVLSMVGALPEAQREVVMMVYVEGFKYREAAEILDIPIGTVMSRLAAARKDIQGRMTKDMAAQ